jgi:hypothetical protein
LATAFAYWAFGVAALLVALFLAWALYRLARTLYAVEDLLMTTTEEMRETLPEVRQSIGNVNDITAGVNVGMRVAGAGVSRLGADIRVRLQGPAISAAAFGTGLRAGAASLWRSYVGGDSSGEQR